jgi:hypothetical protein
MNTTETREEKRSNREGALAVLEQDLAQSRLSEVFVVLGELSQAEIRTLEPGLRIRVVNGS